MKFCLELKALSDALSIAGRAVAMKGVRPILSNILVSATENEIRLVGTDLEIMIIAKVEAKVEESGHFTIPAKLLSEIVSCIPGEAGAEITLELDSENEHQVHISSGRNKFDLQIQGIEEYPPVPSLEGETIPSFEIKTEIFKQSIKEAAIAMGVEEGNPTQRSICMNFEQEDNPVMVATDSKRLAVTSIPNFQVPGEFKQIFIVPSRAIPELLKLMDGQEKIEAGLYKEQLVFSTPKFQLITRLISGKFPDYNRVLPKESSRALRINKKEITQAMKAVLPIARHSSMLVHLDIAQGETRVWAESQEQGMSEVFVTSSLEGEDINIAFNVKFIQDFISVLDDEEVLIEMTTPSYPGVLKPGNPESKFQYVVMPMSY
jgi:DNA polymerase-3 subunit beta